MVSRSVQPQAGRDAANVRALINTIQAGQGRVVGMATLQELTELEPNHIRCLLKRVKYRERRGNAPRIVGVRGLGYRFERERA